MSNRDARLLIDDILESASRILNYVGSLNYEEFLLDTKTSDAVVRNFEIIGEAAKHVPLSFKAANSQVEWRQLTGFRNK